jgi:multimeric flavodoxin WrbA
MRLLAVSGSSHEGGNTTLLLEEALKAAAGRVETELVELASYGPAGHRREGALEDVVAKMRAADALLLGTPSHFGMPSARLKAVLDATWEDAKKGALANKPAASFAVESESGGELAAMGLAHFCAVHRMAYVGYVVGRASRDREILMDLRAIREARTLAARVVDLLEMRRH